MRNDRNFSNEKNRSIAKNAADAAGIDAARLQKALENGNAEDYIMKNLDQGTAAKLKNVLSDKENTQQLLDSPQARALMKKILGE